MREYYRLHWEASRISKPFFLVRSRLCCGLLLLLCAWTPAPAQPVDALTLDVVGLKLRETGEQVIRQLQSRFGATEGKDLQVMRAPGEFVPGKRYIGSIGYENQRFRLGVSFVEVFPYKPSHREAVVLIQYTPVLPSRADAAQFETALIQKYGLPTVRYRGSPSWCKDPENMDNRFVHGVGIVCPPLKEAVLEYNNMHQLLLQDRAYERRMRETFNQTVTQGKPPL